MPDRDHAYLVLDLWMAVGLDSQEFEPYWQRNGLADTWSNLLSAVRRNFQGNDWCRHPMDDGSDFCVLRPGHFGPHWASTDVGSTEPLPFPGGPR
jgi:hypothetical protein